MTNQHTPGPWAITRYEGGGRFPSEPADHFVAIDGEGWGALTRVPIKVDGEPSAEGEANARLIAAAPAMLEALKGLRDELCGVDQWWGALREAADKADAAITQATQDQGGGHD